MRIRTAFSNAFGPLLIMAALHLRAVIVASAAGVLWLALVIGPAPVAAGVLACVAGVYLWAHFDAL